MSRARPYGRVAILVACVAGGLTACGQQSDQTAAVPGVEDRSFALEPASVPVRVAFMTGQLKDMRVTDRVERGTGKVVNPPKLQATLLLKNTAEDRTARLLGGTIAYADTEGQPIVLAEGRRDTSFRFFSYQTDRLDPGMETTQSIDVPFPAAALGNRSLGNIRLELTYMPLPYEEETTRVTVSLKR